MIHFHKWEEVKKEVFTKFWDENNTLRTRIYYRCTRCGKRKTEAVKGDWT
jgi:DNA-binding PadR family transcriptional regulator